MACWHLFERDPESCQVSEELNFRAKTSNFPACNQQMHTRVVRIFLMYYEKVYVGGLKYDWRNGGWSSDMIQHFPCGSFSHSKSIPHTQRFSSGVTESMGMPTFALGQKNYWRGKSCVSLVPVPGSTS